MIRVTFDCWKEGGSQKDQEGGDDPLDRMSLNYRAFTIKGHADTGPYGEDLLCNSVSVLAQAAVNTLTEVCRLQSYINYEMDSGYFAVTADDRKMTREERSRLNLVLRGLVLNLGDLAGQFPDHIEIAFREVEE